MKKNRIFFLFLLAPLLFFNCTGAQNETNLAANIAEDNSMEVTLSDEYEIAEDENYEPYLAIKKIVQAIIDGKKDEVAQAITYPLKRDAPLPPIKNVEEFMAQFDLLFDANLMKRFMEFIEAPDYIDLTYSNGTIGIIDGFIWFSESGKDIISINYSSEAEQEKRSDLDKKVKNAMHPAARNYTYSIYIGKTDDYLFRIDELEDTDKGLRYTQWRADQTMADEPDFMLYYGHCEKMGSAGGYQTTFHGKDTISYLLDQVWLCGEDDCGDFLIIQNEKGINYKKQVSQILDPFEVLP
jgi:hypothetical protein